MPPGTSLTEKGKDRTEEREVYNVLKVALAAGTLEGDAMSLMIGKTTADLY